MKIKTAVIFLIIFFLIFISFKFFLKKSEKAIVSENNDIKEEISTNSNIIEDVSYVSKDARGNEYIINAKQGEIDYEKENIIYLTNVRAIVRLTNSNDVIIKSDYGKYNTLNFDTIFSRNVRVDYLENTITGEYLDFSINRNSMIISRNVIYTNLENILKADVVEINIETKDTKIFMYDTKKKVNIKSKDSNGNN